MTKFGIGQPVQRTEDQRFLTGRGRYTADLALPGQAFLHVLRSPHAHARVLRLDTAAARGQPGVLAVITAADLEAAGIRPIPCQVPLKQTDGTPLKTPPWQALARDRVRMVGDGIAAVVAETAALAQDAAELIEVDYEPLPAVTGAPAALAAGAPQIWDEAPDNLCFTWEAGNRAGTEAAFRSAARTVHLEFRNNRVAPCPLEGRAAIAQPDPARAGGLVLTVSSQGVHDLRDQLAEAILGIDPCLLRVITPDVGGAFGLKMFAFPEYVLVLHAARVLGRPVRWVAERGESFLADSHGRDHVTRAELALDESARFLGLRVDIAANLGAYLSNYAPFVPTLGGASLLAGVYTTPAIHVRVRGAFTNTAPVDAYRGAGRPEAAYCVERLVDAAARDLGIDPADLRRRNMIPAAAMPYRTAMGKLYDSGDFAGTLAAALERADRAGFEARRQVSRAAGRLRGFGFATYIEACSGGPPEQASVQVDGHGRVTVLIGTQSSGQGHETAYRQIIAEHFGLPPARITVVQGDTGRIVWGAGTGGSRSGPVGGAALTAGAQRVLTQMIEEAADRLEAAAADIRLVDGRFEIVGTDRGIAWDELAAHAAPAGGGLAFSATERWQPSASTFPNGTHVCELEIDPDTGQVRIDRYTVVDDFGTLLNPVLVAGQVQGGVAQGIGQALLEEVVYDPDSGQLVTGAFTDYALPRADTVPSIDLSFRNTPCTTNPLGMKGAGEAGAIGAPPAVINALVDALAEFGVRHVDMPATPEVLWRLIRRRTSGRAP